VTEPSRTKRSGGGEMLIDTRPSISVDVPRARGRGTARRAVASPRHDTPTWPDRPPRHRPSARPPTSGGTSIATGLPRSVMTIRSPFATRSRRRVKYVSASNVPTDSMTLPRARMTGQPYQKPEGAATVDWGGHVGLWGRGELGVRLWFSILRREPRTKSDPVVAVVNSWMSRSPRRWTWSPGPTTWRG
jgi:hypothetical protein